MYAILGKTCLKISIQWKPKIILARYLQGLRKTFIDMNDNLKWNLLKEKVQQASEMKPGDNVHGIKTAYRSVLKLMDMIEDGDFLDNVIFGNGMFKKVINILSL